MTLHRATSIDDAVAATGDYRAGGTDLQERLRHDVHPRPLVDLASLDELTRIEPADDGGVTVGALVTVATGASELATSHPAVARAAAALATPQIRAVATIGGKPDAAHPVLVLPPRRAVVLQVRRRRLPGARRRPQHGRGVRPRPLRAPAPVVDRHGAACQ